MVLQPLVVTALAPLLWRKNCFSEFSSDAVLNRLHAATKEESIHGCGAQNGAQKRRVSPDQWGQKPDPIQKQKSGHQVQADQKNGTLRAERNFNRPSNKFGQPSPDAEKRSRRGDAGHRPKQMGRPIPRAGREEKAPSRE